MFIFEPDVHRALSCETQRFTNHKLSSSIFPCCLSHIGDISTYLHYMLCKAIQTIHFLAHAIHWPLTHHPHRPSRPTKPTKNPPNQTISSLYDVLHYSAFLKAHNAHYRLEYRTLFHLFWHELLGLVVNESWSWMTYHIEVVFNIRSWRILPHHLVMDYWFLKDTVAWLTHIT